MKRACLAFACLAGLSAIHPGRGETGSVALGFGEKGLSRLTFGGEDLVSSKSGPSLLLPGADGKLKSVPAKSLRAEGGETILFEAEGLTVRTNFQVRGDCVEMETTFLNTGSSGIPMAEFRPFVIKFPTRPQGSPWNWGYSVTAEADGAPGVVSADWGPSKMVLCLLPGSRDPASEDRERPVVLGFSGAPPPAFESPVLYRVTFSPALAPGESWRMKSSLRFAPSGTKNLEMAAEVFQAFAEKYPFVMNWPDRRPIGAIFLANSGKNWPTNPRGWLNEPSLDTTSPEGREKFRTKLMALADASLQQLQSTGSQGVIVWDIEGGEKPHAVTYLGDPRVLSQFAPEMDAVADEFMRKFTDAGYKVGVCIRPSKIIEDPVKGGPKHQQVEDAIAEMSDKIAYAKKRWGATIFYMDTNVTWKYKDASTGDQSRGMWQGDATKISSADMVRLAKMHPDVFIFPEFGRFGYFSAVGVYDEAKTGGRVKTADNIRQVYPDAATVWKLGDVDFAVEWDGFLEGALAGDIHVFRGWFGDAANVFVGHLQREVEYLKQSRELSAQPNLETGLRSQDPVMRYAAVRATSKPTPAEVAQLSEAVQSESDWVIRRQIVLALGRSGSPDGVSLLRDLALDPKANLYAVSTVSLAMLGSSGETELLELAADKNPKVAGSALRALAGTTDAASIPRLIEIADSSSPALTALAVRALGTREAKASTEKLISMLSGDNPQVLVEACKALENQKAREAVPALVDLILRSVKTLKNNQVREAAGNALDTITGLNFGTFEGQWKKAMDSGLLQP